MKRQRLFGLQLLYASASGSVPSIVVSRDEVWETVSVIVHSLRSAIAEKANVCTRGTGACQKGCIWRAITGTCVVRNFARARHANRQCFASQCLELGNTH